MSDNWRGGANPGHLRRLQRWREIEDEFDEPIAETIMGLREQGNTWRTVAGCLNVSLSTLLEWRQVLGLPISMHEQKYDPSSLPESTPTDKKAQALGYKNARDAVFDMRLGQKLTLKQAAIKLGVHPHTIMRYTSLELRGSIYNRSEFWWQQRRQWAAEMLERFKRKYDNSVFSRHPFDKDNDIVFQRRGTNG